MSKKHFVAIARVIREQMDLTDSPETEKTLKIVAEGLADEFRKVNPRFDRSRFMYAATGE